jgi:hypothetical protein
MLLSKCQCRGVAVWGSALADFFQMGILKNPDIKLKTAAPETGDAIFFDDPNGQTDGKNK